MRLIPPPTNHHHPLPHRDIVTLCIFQRLLKYNIHEKFGWFVLYVLEIKFNENEKCLTIYFYITSIMELCLFEAMACLASRCVLATCI